MVELKETKSEAWTAAAAAGVMLTQAISATSDERFWGFLGAGAFFLVLAWIGRIIVKSKRIRAGGDEPERAEVEAHEGELK